MDPSPTLVEVFTSHLTQNRSFRGRCFQPLSSSSSSSLWT